MAWSDAARRAAAEARRRRGKKYLIRVALDPSHIAHRATATTTRGAISRARNAFALRLTRKGVGMTLSHGMPIAGDMKRYNDHVRASARRILRLGK